MANNVPRLKARYAETAVPALQQEFEYSNAMMVPRLQKIVINLSMKEAIQNVKLLEAAAALTLSRMADSDDASQEGGFGRPGENEKNEETPTVLAGQEGDSFARGGWRTGADVGGHGRGADDTVRGLIDEVIDEVDSEGYRVYAVSGYY